jgi:hypothetical protein
MSGGETSFPQGPRIPSFDVPSSASEGKPLQDRTNKNKLEEGAEKADKLIEELSPRRTITKRTLVKKASKQLQPTDDTTKAKSAEKEGFFSKMVRTMSKSNLQRTVTKAQITKATKEVKAAGKEAKEVEKEEKTKAKEEKAKAKEEAKADKAKAKEEAKAEKAKAKEKTKATEKVGAAKVELDPKEEEAKLIAVAGRLISEIKEKKDYLNFVGIFRVVGLVRDVKEIDGLLKADSNANITKYSIEDLTSALKSVLGELKVVSSRDIKSTYLTLGSDPLQKKEDIEKAKGMLQDMDPAKRPVLQDICKFCVEISKNEKINLMSTSNLGITPGQKIVEDAKDAETSMEEGPKTRAAFTFLLDNYEEIFGK